MSDTRREFYVTCPAYKNTGTWNEEDAYNLLDDLSNVHPHHDHELLERTVSEWRPVTIRRAVPPRAVEQRLIAERAWDEHVR